MARSRSTSSCESFVLRANAAINAGSEPSNVFSTSSSSSAACASSLETREETRPFSFFTMPRSPRRWMTVYVVVRLQPSLSLHSFASSALGSGGDVRQDSQVLTVNRGSGKQEVVVTQRLYPTYQGAVVVCQGAGDSRVRLRVMETVAVLTGLSSDKISVVQWKQ